MLSCGAVLLVLISIAIFRLKPCRKKMKPAEITESKTAATDV